MSGLSEVDINQMRDQLFFGGPERGRRLSRYWLLLPLAAVIASAGVVSDSTATVIGAMIVAPLMTPVLGIVPLWINSDRIDKTSIQQSEVQAVAEHWANGAGWSVTGVTATGDQILIGATGPNPAPSLTVLRHDLNAAGLNGLDVQVSLIPVRYQPLPK
jgi:hypothetical protein